MFFPLNSFPFLCYYFLAQIVRRNVQYLAFKCMATFHCVCLLFGSAVATEGRRGRQASGQQGRTVLDLGTGAGAQNHPGRNGTADT